MLLMLSKGVLNKSSTRWYIIFAECFWDHQVNWTNAGKNTPEECPFRLAQGIWNQNSRAAHKKGTYLMDHHVPR